MSNLMKSKFIKNLLDVLHWSEVTFFAFSKSHTKHRTGFYLWTEVRFMANKSNECNFFLITAAIESLLLLDMDFSASKIKVYLKKGQKKDTKHKKTWTYLL